MVSPQWIIAKIEKSKLKLSSKTEHLVLKSEIILEFTIIFSMQTNTTSPALSNCENHVIL